MPPAPVDSSSPYGSSAIATTSPETATDELSAPIEFVEPSPPAGNPVDTASGPVTADRSVPSPEVGRKYFKTFPTCGHGACSKQCGSLCPAAGGDDE